MKELLRQSWQGQMVNYYYQCIMASSDLENEVAVCSRDTSEKKMTANNMMSRRMLVCLV